MVLTVYRVVGVAAEFLFERFDTKLRSNVVDLQERMAVEKRTLQQ